MMGDCGCNGRHIHVSYCCRAQVWLLQQGVSGSQDAAVFQKCVRFELRVSVRFYGLAIPTFQALSHGDALDRASPCLRALFAPFKKRFGARSVWHVARLLVLVTNPCERFWVLE